MDYPRCDRCEAKGCRFGSPSKHRRCPSNHEIDRGEVVSGYQDEAVRDLYLAAAKVEKGSYLRVRGALTPVRPRIIEVIAFARETGMEKVGVAFCSGLAPEAEIICGILEKSGLDVASVMCKCLSIEKIDLDIPEEDYIAGRPEKGCNPLLQARLLNEAGTDLNLIVGLCVGHDILFTQHSDAPVSTLVVKDRMTGHNPLAALHSRYFREMIELASRER